MRYLLFLSLLFLITVAATCGGPKSGPAPSPAPEAAALPTPATDIATPSPEPTALTASPLSLLQASLAAMEAADSFAFDMSVEIEARGEGLTLQVPLSLVGVFQAPDRAKGKVSTRLFGLSLESQFVSIGGTTYVTNPQTGDWEITPGPLSPFGSSGKFTGPEPTALEGLVLLGEETLAEKLTYHLAGTVAPEAFGQVGAKGELRVEYWIGASDSLLVQIAVNGSVDLGEVGSPVLAGVQAGTATVAMALKFSDFGKLVSVEAPEVNPAATEGPGVRLPEQGVEHVQPGEAHPPYNSTPATSGWHFATPLAPAPWGVHDEVLPDEVLVHNLEHGGIGIHYDCPEGCPDLVALLSTVMEGHDKVIMSPYPGMATRIALTSWTFIDQFDQFDEARIRAFIEAHRDSLNAPEPFGP